MKQLGADHLARPEFQYHFGDLEWHILETLWSRGAPATVSDLLPSCPGRAYTTIMTTMDRLFQKGMLKRKRLSRAYEYSPRFTRAQWVVQSCAENIRWVLERAKGPEEVGALASGLIDAFAAYDPALLDALETMIRNHRAALDARSSESSE